MPDQLNYTLSLSLSPSLVLPCVLISFLCMFRHYNFCHMNLSSIILGSVLELIILLLRDESAIISFTIRIIITSLHKYYFFVHFIKLFFKSSESAYHLTINI